MTTHTDPYSATIADLEAKVAELLSTIESLKRTRAMFGGNATMRVDAVIMHADKTSTIVEVKSPEGTDLAAIAVKQLETANCPMTGRDLSAALNRAGVKLTMRDPAYSILMALKQRMKTEGDLILMGYGKWALRKWFSPSEIEALDRKWGGTGGRDPQAHAEKTRAAIKKIVARGEQWGKRRTVTGEHMTRAYEAIQRGKSKLAAATAAGIAHPTFAWYWKAFEMENWRPGLPFPPAKRPVELKKAPKKEGMWPEGRSNGHSNGKGPQTESAAPPSFPVGGSH
jgi:hypothetical protein